MTIVYPEEIMSQRIKELEAALVTIRDRKWNTMTQGCNAACEAAAIARQALGDNHD